MAYQHQYSPQGHSQSQRYNPGPAGDLRNQHPVNGSLPPPTQYVNQHRSGAFQPPPQNINSSELTNAIRPPPRNGEIQSQHLMNPAGQKTAIPYYSGGNHPPNEPPQGFQPYNVANPSNYPSNLPGYNAPSQQSMLRPPPTTAGLLAPPLASVNGPNISAPNSMAMPLHGSIGAAGIHQNQQQNSKMPSGNVLRSPPLPGQQFKSATPPPSEPSARHSPASSLQGHNVSSSRSTPTNVKGASTNLMSQHPGDYMQHNHLSHQATTQQPPTSMPLSGPPLPYGQPPSSQSGLAPPPLPGQQYVPQVGLSSPPLPGKVHQSQSGLAPPPLPSQQYNPSTSGMLPPSSNSTYPNQASLTPPPMTGQPHLSQSQMPSPPKPGYPTSTFASRNNTNVYPPGLTATSHPPSAPTNSTYPGSFQNLSNSMSNMAINDPRRPVNLMQEARILPNHKLVENPLRFESPSDQNLLIPPDRKNCKPDVLRCTLKALPHTQNLLNKVKLPLGLVIHPFKDLSSLPVISAGTIVRCKRCRTYINPFVSFVDERRWRCNMCFAVNDTPEEFLHHPVSKTYGEPHTRPECTNSTIEFIAPQEYMLRPPQPAVYMFLMDVSHSAIETGYLQLVCDALLDQLDHLPGDSRTRIGFLTYNQTVHFYRLSEGLAQPQMIIVSDIDDVFVPTPENLLVNLRESKDLVQDLLHQLPNIHNLDVEGETDTYCALGAALEVAKKLMSPFGGRITVFQQSLPSIGPGKLTSREDPNTRAGEVSTTSLNPATDFYKKMALDCSAHQVAIDFFFFNSHYVDLATLSCSSRFSAGDIHYYPALHVVHNPMEAERLSHDLERYLTRKIGFESVMRIRCTKGLSVHTFHGNFFVRSTDLLSLANVSPDSGYAVNLTIEEPLTDLSAACFQAALLYTTSKGERRIRVHTMCVPIVKTPAEIFNSVDCVAVVSLLSKMGVDRSVTASVSDAREALVNAVIDPLKAYKETLPQGMTTGGVYVPPCLRLFPLYVHSMLKHPAFRKGVSTKLDDRVFAMINFKMQPADYFLQDIHPDLYRVDNFSEEGCIKVSGRDVPQPEILPLSAESLSQYGSFLLDCGWRMYLLVGRSTNQTFINDVLGAPQFGHLPDPMYSVPEQENSNSELFQSFIEWLQDLRPHYAPLRVIRDDSRDRLMFLSYLRQDRTESSMSLQEFLIHAQQKLTK